MPKYSERSENALKTAHPDLQRLFREVIKTFDHVIIEGHRNKTDQDKAVESGHSKTRWPNSKHNSTPSNAVDAIPYPVNWKDTKRICYFAGYVKAIAIMMDIPLRWGGDWDNDTDLNDQTFFDLVHFELSPKI